MSECWNCSESQSMQGNYCTSCGSPQNPEMAAQRLIRDLRDLTRGFYGILDLVGATGCPEMTAEGLSERADIDVSQKTWEERFDPTPVPWIKEYLYRNWMDYYDITIDEMLEFAEEHDLLEGEGTSDIEALPEDHDTECSCGDTLPNNPPEVVIRWRDGIEASAVCFECFGEIVDRLA